jgi:hypothetical protein
MGSRVARIRCCLLLIAVASCCPSIGGASEWVYRLYGYRPRVYGYAPSEYVYPRYGFQRGYVYVEGPPYGSAALGPPAFCRAPAEMPPEFPVPGAQIDAGNEATMPVPAGATPSEGAAPRDGALQPPPARADRQAVRVRPAPRVRAANAVSRKSAVE